MDEYNAVQKEARARAGTVAAAIASSMGANKEGKPLCAADIFPDLLPPEHNSQDAVARRLLFYSNMAARSAARKRGQSNA